MTRYILLLTLLASHAPAEDWLRFRGPNGSGVSETSGVSAEFGPDRNLAWKTQVPFGRSSPVVAGNHIFLTASEGEKLITLCLDRVSGKILWRREVTRSRHMPIFKGNDPASPSPVSDGSNVYVFFAELGLISYGPAGEERWRVPLGPFDSFYGIGASPVLAGDTLLMVCDQRTDSFVLAVDARNGRVRWRVNRSSPVEGYATPIIHSPPAGEPQVLVFGSHALEAYALATGERLWWVNGVGTRPRGSRCWDATWCKSAPPEATRRCSLRSTKVSKRSTATRMAAFNSRKAGRIRKLMSISAGWTPTETG